MHEWTDLSRGRALALVSARDPRDFPIGVFQRDPVPPPHTGPGTFTWFATDDEAADFLCGVVPVLLLFLSYLMVSEVKYPSFKKLNWRAAKPFHKMLTILLVLACFLALWEKILPVVAPLVFTLYLVYGFIRPRLSRQMRADIEEDEDDEDPGPRPAV